MISEEDAKIKVTQGRGMDLLRLEVVYVCVHRRAHARAHTWPWLEQGSLRISNKATLPVPVSTSYIPGTKKPLGGVYHPDSPEI